MDCCASTPLDPAIAETLFRQFSIPGNSGSRTHSYGADAKSVVESARRKLANAVGAQIDEVTFTSGATESNNLVISGLTRSRATGHIVTTEIEHKAVLEPIARLEKSGFEVTRVGTNRSGRISVEDVLAAVREDTLLVSVMHANNETGILQPLKEIADGLEGQGALLHTDAAQTFAWHWDQLRHPRIDMISISGHKAFGPQGVGALITRKRSYYRPPIEPLVVGGGQERGLRAGTLPVALVAALGDAAERAVADLPSRTARVQEIRQAVLRFVNDLDGIIIGSEEEAMDHALNMRVSGVDSEALMVSTKHLIAISNGSACTSSSYLPSHVLLSMGLGPEEISGCVRLSWCHLTPDPPLEEVAEAIKRLR